MPTNEGWSEFVMDAEPTVVGTVSSPGSGRSQFRMLLRLAIKVTTPASGWSQFVMSTVFSGVVPVETVGRTVLYAPAFASEMYAP